MKRRWFGVIYCRCPQCLNPELRDTKGNLPKVDSHGTPLMHYNRKGRAFKPHRQGRSAETRERKAKEKESYLRAGVSLRRRVVNHVPCKTCNENEPHVIQDYTSGDTICEGCGTVLGEKGSQQDSREFEAGEYSHIPIELLAGCRSRAYQRDVHYGVRMRQLLCLDPTFNPEMVEAIAGYIQTFGKEKLETEFECPAEKWGPQSFRKLLGHRHFDIEKYPHWGGTRVVQHWIQLRMELGYEPWDVQLESQVQHHMKMRYRIVVKAFEALKEKDGNHHTRRRNIYTLNYIIAQLLRLEDPEAFAEYGKFLPQSESPKQPAENNAKWLDIVEWCKVNGKWDFGDDAFHGYEWDYHPITGAELVDVFGFFK